MPSFHVDATISWNKTKSLSGINYYHESMGYLSKTDDEINTDLDRMLEKTNVIKLYYNPYNSDNLANIKNIVTLAKAKGFYVIWNENNDSVTFTADNWDDYVALVVADAAQAESVGADEFLVGNEMSIHNDGSADFNDENLIAKIKALYTASAANFSKVISVEEGWWKKDAWNLYGLDPLPKIYFTLYENDADFEERLRDIWAKFGLRALIGEWSTQSVYANVSFSTVTGDGEATAQDAAGSPAGEQAPKAFDTSLNSKWLQFKDGGVPFWIQYDFGAGNEKKILEYTLATANDAPERDPKTWVLKASNTGAFAGEEVTLDTVADANFSTERGVKKAFVCDVQTTTAYRYYRLEISDLRDLASANSCQIAEIELVETLSEEVWAEKIASRITLLNEIGIKHFIFCYRDTGAGNNDMGFGLWKYTVDEAHNAWDDIEYPAPEEPFKVSADVDYKSPNDVPWKNATGGDWH